MTKAVVFDIDGVVIDSGWDISAPSFCARTGIALQALLDYTKANKDRLMLGQQSAEDFWQNISYLAANLSGATIKSLWLEEIEKNRRVDNLMLSLISDLRKNYKVGALTNVFYTRLPLDYKIKLYDNFDFSFLSCLVGLKKPDAKFFQLAIDQARCEPSEIVYVDNNPIHIEAAKNLGLHSLLYTYGHGELLKQSLIKLGVKF